MTGSLGGSHPLGEDLCLEGHSKWAGWVSSSFPQSWAMLLAWKDCLGWIDPSLSEVAQVIKIAYWDCYTLSPLPCGALYPTSRNRGPPATAGAPPLRGEHPAFSACLPDRSLSLGDS